MPGLVLVVMAVVVRVSGEGDEALYRRVRGQTSDLEVSLEVERGALEAGLAAQVAAARGLASARGARVVVWFEARDEDLVVLVAEPATGRVLARRLEAGGDDGERARSARLEAAAQVVRSSLRALAAGGEIGVALPRETLEAREARPAPPSRPARARLGWRAALGWQLGLDGSGAVGQALAGRVGAVRGALALDAFAAAGTAARLDDERSSVELARHAAGLALSVSRAVGPTQLSAGVSAGAAIWRRSTVVQDPAFMATPSRTTVSFSAAPELRVAWWPAGGPVGVELTVGVDVVAPTPRLVYRTAGGVETRNDLWTLQPRLGLAVVLRTGD